MKNYFKVILPVLLMFFFTDLQAQTKKVTTKSTSSKKSTKVVERNLGTPSSISEITDVTESDAAYGSLKNLIENYSVSVTYADNTFRGKESLKRGDFIVALNSALNGLKSKLDAAALDTTIFNTYDRNRGGAYLTNVSQVKDIKESSIYYTASKSMIEQWGIAAPFGVNKTLSPNTVMTEKEVYDILRATMGYNSPGVNPYSTGMNRSKFAIILNNAVRQKMTEISSLKTVQQNRIDAERRQQADSLKVVDKARKDSIAKEIALRKQEAEKQEIEAKKKLSEKKRR